LPELSGNKLSRDSFSTSDLIKISNFLNCDLVFEVNENQKNILEISDIKDKENKIVLLHGFIKKTDKIPANEIEIAKKRLSDYRRGVFLCRYQKKINNTHMQTT